MSRKLYRIKGFSLGGDGLPVDLHIDAKWLAKEMKRTGKPAGTVLADHILDAFHKDLRFTADVCRQYHALSAK